MTRLSILASIRQSLAAARHLPAAPEVQVSLPVTEADPAVLEQQFAAELQAVGGFFVALPAAAVAAHVLEWCAQRQAGALAAWDAAHLPVPGLLDALRAGGLEVVSGEVPREAPARDEALARLERLAVGLTGADAALADTGSLALRAGPGRPRLASLSVSTHIALFTPQQLHPSLAAWLHGLGSAAGEWVAGASNLTLITGPSRTADIEMTLTIGVHGPGEVLAVLVR